MQFAKQKAAELEVFHSPAVGPGKRRRREGGENVMETENNDSSTEDSTLSTNGSSFSPPAKRPRSDTEGGGGGGGEMEEGQKLIEEFMRDVRSLPLRDLSPADLKQRLEGMREKVLATGNSYVLAIAHSCNNST